MAEDNKKKKDSEEKGFNMENATRVGSAEEMIAILDGRAIKVTENGETRIFFLRGEEKLEVAREIAQMYIERFPRPLSYGATIQFFDEDYRTFYHQLTDEELEIIRTYNSLPKDEDEDEDWGNLGDYLEDKGHQELFDKLTSYDHPGEFVALESCDLEAPLKFTTFSIRTVKEDGSLQVPAPIGFDLTDEEFVELLAQCLLESGNITMNNLIYRAPEITPRIIRHLMWGIYDFNVEYKKPAVCDADELKEITRSILDPAQDVLHLSESEDIRILAFLKEKKISK